MRSAMFAGICVLCAAQENHAANPLSIPVQLTHAQNFDPSLAPDGKRMVYVSVIAGREQLITIDADGANATEITRDSTDHEDPAWSPDGKQIAYTHVSQAEERIFVMNVDGTNDHAVSPAGKRTIHPQWSSDGARIIYCTDDDLAPPLAIRYSSLIYTGAIHNPLQTPRVEALRRDGARMGSPSISRTAKRKISAQIAKSWSPSCRSKCVAEKPRAPTTALPERTARVTASA